jgi:uncharacterized membrane protein (DUF485 family)
MGREAPREEAGGSGTRGGDAAASVPARVRVTGPERRRVRPGTPSTREIDEDTAVGAIYMGSLLREQLRLAGVVLLALVLGIGALPLLFHFAPDLAGTRLLGVPLSWLVLGVGVYPLLLLLGWAYVRRAERNENDFVALVSERADDGPDR